LLEIREPGEYFAGRDVMNRNCLATALIRVMTKIRASVST
jgi:hypothetical protein